MGNLYLKMPKRRMRLALDAHTREGEILRTFEVEKSTGRVIVTATQDVEPILKSNKRRLRDSYDRMTSRPGLGTHTASVPNVIIEKWMREYGINALNPADNHKVLALLDSPEWSALRTSRHRLSRRPVRTYFRGSTPSGPLRLAK